MSEVGILHGWRSRVFYLTRDRRFLLRTAGTIVAAGFLIASLIVTTKSGSLPSEPPVPLVEQRLQADYSRLISMREPDPRALATWLRRQVMVMARKLDDEETLRTAFDAFSQNGVFDGHDWRQVIDRHAAGVTKGLVHDYIRASLIRELPDGVKARERLEQQALKEPPPMLANELRAGLALMGMDSHDAVPWMMREGMHFPEAKEARRSALNLAVAADDVDSLRQMRAEPGWVEESPPLDQYFTGALLQDVPLQWKGLLLDHFTDIPWLLVGFTLFAGLVWLVILVQHDGRDGMRWARPVLPVLAGVFSVWPTLSILAWQEHVQGLKAGGEFPHDVWYYIMGVGMREEVCKLALFAVFLPWLLRQRAPGRALITGAFVGLGFAIEENVQYYAEHGLSSAITRLLTANFLHLSITAITAHSLYRMFRSGFAEVGQFMATFAGVVLLHGLYDWLPSSEMLAEEGGFLSLVLFVLLASRFIDLLLQEAEPRRSTFALRAVFTLGCALLVAAVLVVTATDARSMAGVADAAKECLGYVPLAVLYWRRFAEA
jgi:RsiW-degrading membrane proteinase PrsW (M82 family)